MGYIRLGCKTYFATEPLTRVGASNTLREQRSKVNSDKEFVQIRRKIEYG